MTLSEVRFLCSKDIIELNFIYELVFTDILLDLLTTIIPSFIFYRDQEIYPH